MVLFSFRLFFTIISYFSFTVIPVINCSHICSPFYRSYCETGETSEIFEISGTFWTSETTHLICLFFIFSLFRCFPSRAIIGRVRIMFLWQIISTHKFQKLCQPNQPAEPTSIFFRFFGIRCRFLSRNPPKKVICNSLVGKQSFHFDLFLSIMA